MNLWRVVDDDMLLELLVLVNVLEDTFNDDIVTDSVVCAIAVEAIILRKKISFLIYNFKA